MMNPKLDHGGIFLVIGSSVVYLLLALTIEFNASIWRENPKGNKEIWESREMS